MKPRKVNETHVNPRTGPLTVLIFYASIGSGHLSAAQSIRDALLAGAACRRVTLVDALPPRANRTGFTSFLSAVSSGLMPGVYTRAWESGSMAALFTLSARFPWIHQRVLRAVEEQAPDVVVCTHALPCAILAAQPARSYRLLGVSTDFQVHAYWPVHGVDGYAVASQPACDRLRQHGAPAQLLRVLGIPVRPQFSEQSGIVVTGDVGHHPLRVLVIAGGGRAGPYIPLWPRLLRIMRTLSMTRLEGVEWRFIFGSSGWLQRQAEKLLGGRTEISLLGLTDAMASHMAWADVVMTKAGGLTLAEAFALGKPVFILRRGAGQEAANTALVLQVGAGLLLNSADDLLDTLRAFARDPETLEGLARAARASGRPQAAYSVANWVEAMAGEV